MSEQRITALSPTQVKLLREKLAEEGDPRSMAMFSLAIDAELHPGDIVSLTVSDVMEKGKLLKRPVVLQGRTQKRVAYRMSTYTRRALMAWIVGEDKAEHDPLFTSARSGRQVSVGSYRRMVREWMVLGGLDPETYGAQSLRGTRASLVKSKTANVKAARDVLGHGRKKPTIRDFGGED